MPPMAQAVAVPGSQCLRAWDLALRCRAAQVRHPRCQDHALKDGHRLISTWHMLRQPCFPLDNPFHDLAPGHALARQGILISPPLKRSSSVILRVPPRSATVRVFSINTSNAEPFGAREVFGRPLGLPLRPLANQPGLRAEREWDLLFTMRAPQGAARGPISPTSVQRQRRHSPD